MDGGMWWSGLSQALVTDIPSCAELVARIMGEAGALHGQLHAHF
jgi:NADH:quinone reductase (non-electrogenic)